MEVLNAVKEKSGPGEGQLSASRVLALFVGGIVGLTLVGAWGFWFLGILGVVPAISWSVIGEGMTWLGITFLGSILPLVLNYLKKE